MFPLIVFILGLLALFVRHRSRFWSQQPVFHYYDVFMWFKPGIISKELPPKNKYVNLVCIQTMSNLVVNALVPLIHLIQTHYLNQPGNHYLPKEQNVLPYFAGHNHPCFVSLYSQPGELDTGDGRLVPHSTVVGGITSRPLQVHFLDDSKVNRIYVYYVDYLCVHGKWRNKQIAPQLIQTHEYNQSHRNKRISVSLFRREDVQAHRWMVPLVAFETVCYRLSDLEAQVNVNPNKTNDPSKQLIAGTRQNVYYGLDFLKDFDKPLKIYPDLGNIVELVASENLLVRMVIQDSNVQAIYIFRHTCTTLYDQGVISLVLSQKGDQLSQEEFVFFFWKALSREIRKTNKYSLGFVSIETLGDNIGLNKAIRKEADPVLSSPVAYYLYNLAHRPIAAKDCLILH